MARYRKYYSYRYRRHRREDPLIVVFIGSSALLLSRLLYYLIKGVMSFFWLIFSGKKSTSYSNEFPEEKPRQKSGQTSQYYRKNSLLTEAESNFYKVLDEIAQENNYIVESKVRLEALIGVHFFAENWWGLRNRIKSREMDFVLCEKKSGNLNPVLVIELDDLSHIREDRIERDQNLDRILRDARLPMLHVLAAYSYDKEILLQDIRVKILAESINK